MRPGDVVFGISPSGVSPRRIVFAARLAERLTFAQAYDQYPDLRGPDGPIHVRPASIPGPGFPESEYEHIPGGNHPSDWRSDLRTRELDAFFTCEPAGGCLGRWLGADGPVVSGPILGYLRTCQVWGRAGLLSLRNESATEDAPVRHGRLYTGLHLETDTPDRLVTLICGAAAASGTQDEPAPARIISSRTRRNRSSCR